MPMYEYQCPKCGEIKEYRHKMDEKPVIGCPVCGNANMIKRPSVISVHTRHPVDIAREGFPQLRPDEAMLDCSVPPTWKSPGLGVRTVIKRE